MNQDDHTARPDLADRTGSTEAGRSPAPQTPPRRSGHGRSPAAPPPPPSPGPQAASLSPAVPQATPPAPPSYQAAPPPPSYQRVPQAAPPLRPRVQTKSVALAAVLGFFFGPLGMLYSTVVGAAVMFVMCTFVAFVTLGFGLVLMWPICAIWAAVSASATNDRSR